MASKRTMTIQTQTPGGQKPPTLAELQRLCEQKGQALVIDGPIIKLYEQRTWWLQVVYGPLNHLTGGTLVREKATALACVFAALFALPDKERAR